LRSSIQQEHLNNSKLAEVRPWASEKSFPGGATQGFSHSRLRKQLCFAVKFKIQGRVKLPLLPSDAHGLDKILRNFTNLKDLNKCIFRIVDCISLKQGCGTGTQISGSGWRHLKFLTLDPAPTSKNVWLLIQNDLVN